MKLKYKFVINRVANSLVAVPVGETKGFSGYIKLNETGAFIFEKLKADTSKEEITDSLLSEFDGCTRPQAEKTVDNFLEKLKAADMLL